MISESKAVRLLCQLHASMNCKLNPGEWESLKMFAESPAQPAPATVTVEGLEKAMAIELGCCPNTVSFDGLSPNWRVISEVCARVALNLLGEVRRG